MDISIIIPTLNELDRIAESIERAQALGPFEVIVVDGTSFDGTADKARTLECRVVVCAPGRGIQLNAGARHARGNVLLFLHADCWLPRHAIDQIEAVLKRPRVAGGAFQQLIDARAVAYRLLERGNTLRARVLKIPYGDQGLFARREAFWAVGGFPNVPIMEDLLFMRKLRRVASIACLPGPIHVSPRRWQRYGILRQTLRNWRLLAAFALGESPQDLAEFYTPYSEHLIPLTVDKAEALTIDEKG